VIDGEDAPPAHDAQDMPAWGAVFAAEGLSERAIDQRITALIRYIEARQRQTP
jgi:hypothetical protein